MYVTNVYLLLTSNVLHCLTAKQSGPEHARGCYGCVIIGVRGVKGAVPPLSTMVLGISPRHSQIILNNKRYTVF
jgi:hypothetical protein